MGVRVREKGGCWYVFVNHENRRKAKKVGPGAEGLRLARALADRMIVRLAYGESLEKPSKVPLFKDYADDWLRQVQVTKKPGTAEVYQRHMRRTWIPSLGKYPLDRINRGMVKNRLVKLQASGLSRDYVFTMLTPLQACLSEAVDEELIKANPAARMSRAMGPRLTTAREIFTEPELERLFEAAIARWPAYYIKLLLLARTGMRQGEMLALKPEDIDFERQQIWIRRTWGSRDTSKKAGCINMPKSGKWRWVEMSPQLIEVLRSYLAQLPAKSEWLFTGKNKALPQHPAGFQFIWRKILAAAEVHSRPPHSLRHTYVSMLIDRGETMLYVRDQLGHSSIKITMDIYGHLIPSSAAKGVAKLDSSSPVRNPYICNLSATTPLRLITGGDKSP